MLAMVCPLLAGCGAAAIGNGPGSAVVRISERDFHLAASARTIRAGVVDLSVHNQGPDDHELLVVRDRSNAPLPIRRDGVTVDEERLTATGAEVGLGLEPGAPGSVRVLRLRLTPGRYVLFCNMAGHYLSGMRIELLVR
jgi:uncharacterized cupredoxin-like copper-binding protein